MDLRAAQPPSVWRISGVIRPLIFFGITAILLGLIIAAAIFLGRRSRACDRCGESVRPGASFCPRCGNEVSK